MGQRRQPGLFAGERFADRYLVEREVGRGAYGVVYRALDEITDELAALKVLYDNRAQRTTNRWREASVLRRLRIPGVVTFYDEGVVDGRAYVSMEFLEGEPFFGPRQQTPWEEMRPHVVRLLEVLSVVHRQGVVHGDIKPSNVMLVDDEAGIRLLDFGLSVSTTAAELELDETGRGTPIYMAPELFRSKVLTPKTDLWAVGTMLFEALTARPFFSTGNLIEWVRRVTDDGPPRLQTVEPDAPDEAALLVDALLSPADERPGSAAAALELLGRAATQPRVKAIRDETWDVEQLTDLFTGIEPGFHLRTGPAKELHSRTGGDPDEVVAELNEWVRAGLAHYDGEKYSVSYRSLGSLRNGLVTRGEPAPPAEVDEGWLERQIELARGRAARGDMSGAQNAFRDGWLACRGHEELDPSRLLRAWAELALLSLHAGVVEEVLWAMDGRGGPITTLLEAQRAAFLGRRERVVGRLRSLGALSDPWLEGSRLIALTTALSFEDPEFASLNDRVRRLCEENEGLEDLMASVALRDALGLYAQGLYRESAEKHIEIARNATNPGSRLSSMFHAAWGFLDAFEFERAAEWAQKTADLAEELGSVHIELLARVATRTARYRTGESLVPDEELVAAAERDAGVTLRMATALVEGANHWRMGEIEAAKEVLEPVARDWSTETLFTGLTLVASFYAYLKGKASEELLEAAEASTAPRLRAQMLTLLAPFVDAEVAASWRRQAREIADSLGPVRLEILSASELGEPL